MRRRARRLPKVSPCGRTVGIHYPAWLRVPLTWVPAWQALKRRKRMGSTRMKRQMNEGGGIGECFKKTSLPWVNMPVRYPKLLLFHLHIHWQQAYQTPEKAKKSTWTGVWNVILWTKVNMKKSILVVLKTKSTLLNWKKYGLIAYINCLYHVSMTKRPPALASSKVPH